MINRYFPVKLDFLINDNYIECDIFLKINSEYVHYLRKDEYNSNTLKKLSTKDCKIVYLNTEGVQGYMSF